MTLQLLFLYQIQRDHVWFLRYFMLKNSLAESNPKDCDFNNSLAASNTKDPEKISGPLLGSGKYKFYFLSSPYFIGSGLL